jgi:hypothetical protein
MNSKLSPSVPKLALLHFQTIICRMDFSRAPDCWDWDILNVARCMERGETDVGNVGLIESTRGPLEDLGLK